MLLIELSVSISRWILLSDISNVSIEAGLIDVRHFCSSCGSCPFPKGGGES